MGYIGNAPYQGSQIGSGSIQDGSVDTVDLKDGAVTLAKLAATGTKNSTTFLRGDNTFAVVAVTPTAVSDQNNASTGAFDVPSGTTAQRPASPSIGMVRYNTDLSALENYTADGWLKVSIAVPTITSVSGEIYNGFSSSVSLSGTGFGAGAGVVRLTSGATTKDVSVTPSSSTSLSFTVPSEIYSLSAGSIVSIKFTNSDGGQSATYDKTVIATPTGGTITYSGGYRYHSFTSSGSLVVPSGFAKTADVLVLAGGGGGGSWWGGGGGAGGYLSTTSAISANTYPVVVGAGASTTLAGSPAMGANGSNSTFNGLTAIAGGGGSANTAGAGRSGGSGGGGGRGEGGSPAGAGGAGTSGQGNAGGAGAFSPGESGGGGGAGSVGQNSPNQDGASGGAGRADGGAGLTWYDGVQRGGGGGNTWGNATYGGGLGRHFAGAANGQPGSANTGGGGGGSYSDGNGGAGGSGIVVIRYAI